MELFVYKQGGGLAGVAAFLVDQGVVGLKDAWVTMGVDRSEMVDIIDQSTRRGIRMRRVSVDEVRRWVAGGLRWAHDNGMRLPKDWQKPASIIGGGGDWASADVSAFEKEFAGHPEDLRQRLIAEPLETFLQRKDITFTFSTAAPYMDQRTGEYHDKAVFDGEDEDDGEFDDASEEVLAALADQLHTSARAVLAETTAWVTSKGKTPSPELDEAWQAIMLSSMTAKAALPEPRDPKEYAELSNKLLADIARQFEPQRRREFERAIGQVRAHLEADKGLLRRAIDLPSEDDRAASDKSQ